jgi:hypothetical protein
MATVILLFQLGRFIEPVLKVFIKMHSFFTKPEDHREICWLNQNGLG